MPLNSNGLNTAASAVSGAAPYVSLHSALPDANGSSETSAPRKAATWTAGSAGVRQLSAALAFTGGAANGAATHAGLWSAATGGTFYGSVPLTGDTSFNSAGEYTINALSITIS